jgi:hypothetical protein
MFNHKYVIKIYNVIFIIEFYHKFIELNYDFSNNKAII